MQIEYNSGYFHLPEFKSRIAKSHIGVIGFILLFLMQIFIIKPFKRGEKELKIMLLILLLVLNLKGEVLSWGLIVQAVVLLFCLQDNFRDERKDYLK